MAKLQSVEPQIADLANGWLKSYGLDYKLEQESTGNSQIDNALNEYYSKNGGQGGNQRRRGGRCGIRIPNYDRHRHELHPDLPSRLRHRAHHGPLLGVHGAAGGEDSQLPRRGRRRGHADHAQVL